MNEQVNVINHFGTKKEYSNHFCPLIQKKSDQMCPKELCIFWSQEDNSCRWNLWLMAEIIKFKAKKKEATNGK